MRLFDDVHCRLRDLRLKNFSSKQLLAAKLQAINTFFREQNLDSCVVGLSGGVDSAVVYKLLLEASNLPDSPLKMVFGLTMPIYCEGTTGQDETVDKVKELFSSTIMQFPIKYPAANGGLSDLSEVLLEYTRAENMDSDSWAIGQLASMIRIPQLYFHAAILQSRGFKSIVVGTINRDEGAYIGFFGKGSDAMMDLQPIADLHKSEVYDLAYLLDIPTSIIHATPKGDVWDGKTDQEMIGAPYWFIELYILLKDYQELSFDYPELKLDDKTLVSEEYIKYSTAIELIHAKNAHKYRVGNPAHFIDVLPRKVIGGWQ
jgi:NAD+ synthetase